MYNILIQKTQTILGWLKVLSKSLDNLNYGVKVNIIQWRLSISHRVSIKCCGISRAGLKLLIGKPLLYYHSMDIKNIFQGNCTKFFQFEYIRIFFIFWNERLGIVQEREKVFEYILCYKFIQHEWLWNIVENVFIKQNAFFNFFALLCSFKIYHLVVIL